jgi:hypothetical protein
MSSHSEAGTRAHGRITPSDALQVEYGSALVGRDCRLDAWDPAFARLLRLGSRDLRGCHLSEVFPDFRWPTGDLARPLRESGASLRLSRLRLNALRADGSRAPLLVSLIQGADGTALLTIRSGTRL